MNRRRKEGWKEDTELHTAKEGKKREDRKKERREYKIKII